MTARRRRHGNGWLVKALALVVVTGFVVGCSQGSGPGDGGLDDDGGTGSDGGDRVGGSDVDLGEDFGILVPAGTRLCTMCGRAGDVVQEYLHKGRITPVEGLLRLPRGQESVEVDWIESIELGPGRTRAEAVGAGRFDRTLQGSADNGTWRYSYTQEFSLDGEPVSIVFHANFEVAGGAALDPLLVLDTETLSIDAWNPPASARFDMQTLWQDPDSPLGEVHQAYATCDTDLFDLVRVGIEIEGGHRLDLEYHCPDHSQTIVILSTVCPCPLVSASFEADGQQRHVEDHFRLVFSSTNHCDMDQRTLVVLDQPVGSIFAIYVPGGVNSHAGGYPPSELQYLDESFEPVETRTITNWTDE